MTLICWKSADLILSRLCLKFPPDGIHTRYLCWNATKMRCVLLSPDAVLKQKSVGYTKDYLAMQTVETAYSFQTGGVGKITHGA